MTRALTGFEIVTFSLRHPFVATMIEETKAAQAAGLYDYDYNPNTQWRLPGIIPPWGLAVDDSLGSVVIFPARDGTWHYTLADGAPVEVINRPDYQSPPGGSILDDLAARADQLTWGVGIALGLGFLYWLYTNSRKTTA